MRRSGCAGRLSASAAVPAPPARVLPVRHVVWLEHPVPLTLGLPPDVVGLIERQQGHRPRTRVTGYDGRLGLPEWLASAIAEPPA